MIVAFLRVLSLQRFGFSRIGMTLLTIGILFGGGLILPPASLAQRGAASPTSAARQGSAETTRPDPVGSTQRAGSVRPSAAPFRPVAAPLQAPAATYMVYLPMNAVRNTPQPPPPPPPPPPAGAYFLPGDAPTRSFDVAYDAQGGQHMTYISHSQQPNDEKVVYAYCAPGRNCDSVANWSAAIIATGTFAGTQIEVTRDGRPRLLFEPDFTLVTANFTYAECNANCTTAGNWGTVQLSSEPLELASIYGYEAMRRDWFALDPQGRPRLITPLKNAAYYVGCDNDCLGDNWFVTPIRVRLDEFGLQSLEWPVLRFSPDGRAHVLGRNFPYAMYLTCGANCEVAENWELLQLSGDPSNPQPHLMDVTPDNWDLEIDPAGRLVVMAGGFRQTNPNQFWNEIWSCRSACASLSSWEQFGFPGASGGLDLGINRKGIPYFVIGGKTGSTGAGVTILGWCVSTNDCYSPTTRWTDAIVDTQAAMTQQLPVGPLPIACPPGTFEWSNQGGRLMFDSADTVRIFATGVASATCASGLGEYTDRWGVVRRTRGVDIWIFMYKTRVIPFQG
jgi:hypothetical protein